ncbi:MAG: FAD-binding oxidoreductase, partial [Calditrichaeota bacterium]
MPLNDELKWWGWGYKGESFPIPSPQAFWAFLSSRLGEPGHAPRVDNPERIELPASRFSEHELQRLQAVVGEANVSLDHLDRVVHSLGKSYPDLLRLRQGKIQRAPDAVVYPREETQIQRLLQEAQTHRWRVIPFGGGTSVVGGVEPPQGEQPVITLDLRHLNKVLEIDATSGLATVQCGILGPHLEQQLNARGFTLGHFPQSFEFSTLGGWIATRSAGQLSTKYGKIEDLVCSLRVMTPSGTVETALVPAAATGPQVLQMLIGSEGSLGVITRATMRLHPFPHARKFQTFVFRSFAAG